MREKKQPTEYTAESWEQGTYQTGAIQMPKNHGGVIACLLVLVIFLCGIVTALGFANIKLTRQLNQQTEEAMCSMAFSHNDMPQEGQRFSALGFSGADIPDFWQTYHQLPQGVYITQVQQGCEAAAKGLAPGDILLKLDGTPTANWEALTGQLTQYAPGDSITLTVYRAGTQLDLRLTLSE